MPLVLVLVLATVWTSVGLADSTGSDETAATARGPMSAGTISDTLATSNDIDDFFFYTPRDRPTVSVYVSASNTTPSSGIYADLASELAVTLYNAAGTQLADTGLLGPANGNTPDPASGSIDYTLPGGAKYYLSVTHAVSIWFPDVSPIAGVGYTLTIGPATALSTQPPPIPIASGVRPDTTVKADMSDVSQVSSFAGLVLDFAFPELAFIGMANDALGVVASGVANDPPDPNYTAPAVARPLRVSVGEARGSLPNKLRRVLTKLVGVEAHEFGLAQAMLVSIERAQGAAEAGSATWEKTQILNAATFALRWARSLETERAERLQVIRALRDSRYHLHTTPAEFAAATQLLASGHLPANARKVLNGLGLSANDRASVLEEMKKSARRAHQLESLGQVLANPQTLALLKRTAALLTAYSAGAEKAAAQISG